MIMIMIVPGIIISDPAIPLLGIYPKEIEICDHAGVQNMKELLQVNNNRCTT